MTSKRKSQAQAMPLERRRATPNLRVVPREVVSAAEQSVARVRNPRMWRYMDFHPALYMLVGVAILTLIAFIYLGQVNAVGNANYTLEGLRSERNELLHQKQDLQLQIARAQSLRNIEEVAKNRLHMVPIGDQYEYLTVESGPVQAQRPGVGSQESGIGSQSHSP
jgi:hypothetical protein